MLAFIASAPRAHLRPYFRQQLFSSPFAFGAAPLHRYYAGSTAVADATVGKKVTLAVPSTARFNEIGVQQLSSHVHSQVFLRPPTPPDPELVTLSKDHLSRHELLGKAQDASEPIGFDLPSLQGETLDEHFYKLGMDASAPYLDFAKDYSKINLPTAPRQWVGRSGWTKYNADGTTEQVLFPSEDMLTFDTEVMWKQNPFPVMACAASSTAWYAWLSPWLLGQSENPRHLIPLGDPSRSRIIVGHNIGYDRARVLEEYDLTQSRNFFLDTMSLHVAVNGMCSQQRPTWMRHKKNRDLRDKLAQQSHSHQLAETLESNMISEEEEELWVGRSSINSLRDVAKFHCNITIDKAQRDHFGELDRDGIRERLDELLDYCAADVSITHRVYRKVFPNFLETCPHPVSFGALRHLSNVILPVNESWAEYIKTAEETYHTRLNDVQKRLEELCQQAVDVKDKPEIYNIDPWLRQLDWSGQEIRMVKGKKKGDPPRPAARQKMPGMPKWYKDLFPTSTSPMNLTVRTRIAPILLKLSWDGYPLVWSDKYGWTFQVPKGDIHKYKYQAVVQCDMAEEKIETLKSDRSHVYYKLPHKDGPEARCVSPLAKGYLAYFEGGKLSSQFALAKEALEMNASCSYWISARSRIMSQMVVYEEDVRKLSGSQAQQTKSSLGFILPQIIPMGTITRRAVENTWLTASNAKANRVGSELKAMVKAPPGYVFVGADVDSEELWIASLVGDAQFQIHGGNAIGFMTLEGTKAAGTDLHSKTAKILRISRNNAKVFNYGRIYGAGLKFAATLLRQFNPSISEEETRKIAANLYKETKGTRTTRKLLTDSPFWRGGTESFVFNKLEEFADQERPRTPVLGAGITQALMRRFINKGSFMTSRINWAIQSSGVDYLHLLIVSMDFLIRRFNLNARLAISVHDEIRYLVKEEDKYKAAMALQVANVWTRAIFSQQMGIDDLPQSCAYFSAVDVDHVLRKEVDMDCVTPSHLDKIPPGESVDIIQLLEKGEKAFLDPSTAPLIPPTPEKYPYTPRKSIMSSLEGSKDYSYIKAQIASDEKELREIIKGAMKSSSITLEAKKTSVSSTKKRVSNHPTYAEQCAILMEVEPKLLGLKTPTTFAKAPRFPANRYGYGGKAKPSPRL
ncbi:DNA-directed DNA polymerase gamma mip1 [Ophidiomyces ophidiicola]|uniref:DNA-directed DNA polymerase gamma mip1 n=1 Tax=Ophidiomyces ophidiicola TaxID=1387563 RepID=A0ACB8UWY2_9EURO|nr:DNA-directed DNA polymerase gamma mip1 [Ophidiomyces ophidiicola]KAI1972861.1 DNA-directed DNA polymerase gamma mip1 [Ophidiomyces ophidiicola]KAI1981876.1 DNA-directed DNA polymerase gamma mip1 [Ophidiomyces ophidiicola]KAI1991831.1 DNA-directed DNA polymerase gamma mip1 [Ophidiomyces ophidiicola]KAI1996522.1 DNA-directed DNA polymerase gamma mip1 [Ophidiomyces ophidiicola]